NVSTPIAVLTKPVSAADRVHCVHADPERRDLDREPAGQREDGPLGEDVEPAEAGAGAGHDHARSVEAHANGPPAPSTPRVAMPSSGCYATLNGTSSSGKTRCPDSTCGGSGCSARPNESCDGKRCGAIASATLLGGRCRGYTTHTSSGSSTTGTTRARLRSCARATRR